MTDQDKEQFAQAMAGAAEVLGSEITKPKLHLYFECLRHLPIEQVERALIHAVAQLKFFPKPVELLDLAGESRVLLSDRALVESSKTISALERHGAYASVCFDDPVTQAVIERHFGGWPEFCQAVREDGAKWAGKDFCRAYEAFARQGVESHGYLPGICERENALQSYDRFTEPPALIGDQQKALTVMRTGEQGKLPPNRDLAGAIVERALEEVLRGACGDGLRNDPGGQSGSTRTRIAK